MARLWRRPRKILCATDLTPSCDSPLDRALQLGSQWGASVLVVHIVDDTGLQTMDFAAHARKLELKLRQKVKSHPIAASLEVEAMVTLGNPAERILAKCDRLFIDLLVMGPGERTSLGRHLLGSTVDHVLRHALQPVLSVRSGAFETYRNIAVATDFSSPSGAALDCALALFPDAKATVVNAYEDTLHGLLPFDQMTGPLAEQHKREMLAAVEKSMSELVEPVRAVRPDLATAVRVGTPEAALRGYVEEFGCDLVVVGTHGRTGVRRAVIGSVAERLIAKLPCDVLAVRSTE